MGSSLAAFCCCLSELFVCIWQHGEVSAYGSQCSLSHMCNWQWCLPKQCVYTHAQKPQKSSAADWPILLSWLCFHSSTASCTHSSTTSTVRCVWVSPEFSKQYSTALIVSLDYVKHKQFCSQIICRTHIFIKISLNKWNGINILIRFSVLHTLSLHRICSFSTACLMHLTLVL